ncbi:unnamed protein product [Paramecium pentaurelia]|uniref:Uncharacterized protein n=1 Tax=Paramecium pentaurelia TaxID=43138 RepID=A0A8S1S9J1_9CILI|nr:unnamed protein product [Paramecium pentaurelia]
MVKKLIKLLVVNTISKDKKWQSGQNNLRFRYWNQSTSEGKCNKQGLRVGK